MAERLTAIPIPGLSPDNLGNYLASLGLLRVLSRRWPETRIAWRDEVLQVVGGPPMLDDLLDELVRIASERLWTPYVREWADAQKRSSDLAQKPKTSATSGVPFALWQGTAAEELLERFTAHVVVHGAGRSMNPILGKAGKIGQRDFAKGWGRAMDLLAPPKPSKQGKNETPERKQKREKREAEKFHAETTKKRAELKALLQGAPLSWLEKGLNAATWFCDANKIYNNGQSPFREGLISPWLMVLACEGIPFLAGSPSRRLGARARSSGAFPFVTKAAAPKRSGEKKRDSAELWAPLWERPMAASEVVTLFRRGRAELAGITVETPAAFASAVIGRGVDAGVVEFRRFVLGWTTAQDYVEPRFHGTVATPSTHSPTATALSKVLERITNLIEHRGFPRDDKRFAGLRGPIESALLDLAVAPDRPEAGIALLDAVVSALDRIDHSRGFREKRVQWKPLPVEWLSSLFASEAPGTEARLALALVSCFPKALPFTAFRFGVSWTLDGKVDGRVLPRRFEHTKVAPARWVWGPGELSRVLGAVLSRRLLEESKLDRPFGKFWRSCSLLPASAEHMDRWLVGDIDEPLLSAWLSRLALFDWTTHVPDAVRALAVPAAAPTPASLSPNGELVLVGLMQPLVDRRRLVVKGLSPDDLLSEERGARRPEAARALVTLLHSGNLDAALRFAASRFAMAGAHLATFDASWRTHDAARLVAALLFPLSRRERIILFERWLRPRRRPQGDDHVQDAHPR